MYKYLPIILVLIAILGAYLYLPVRRELAYTLGISGDHTISCCNENEVANSKGDFDENASIAFFNGQVIDYPKTSLAESFLPNPVQSSQVLGTTNASGEEKWIEVSLKDQMTRAWEGSRIVMEFPISSGKWSPTPKGTFNIWYKTRSQKMEGGSKDLGTYYNLPNVPSNMFFYRGYALHGAYWHNNFGTPMSHGCVNAPLASAAQIFAWAGPVVPEGQNYVKASAQNPGTKVFVH